MKGLIISRSNEVTQSAILSLPGAGTMTNFTIFGASGYWLDDLVQEFSVYIGTDVFVPENFLPALGSDKLGPGTSNGILFKPQSYEEEGQGSDTRYPFFANSSKKIKVARGQQVHFNIDSLETETIVLVIQYDWVPDKGAMQEFVFKFEGATVPDDFVERIKVPMDLNKVSVELQVAGDMVANALSKVKLLRMAGSTSVDDWQGTFSLTEGSLLGADETHSGGEMYVIDALIGDNGNVVNETFTEKLGKVYKDDVWSVDFDDEDFTTRQIVLTIKGYPALHETKRSKRWIIDYLTLANEMEVL